MKISFLWEKLIVAVSALAIIVILIRYLPVAGYTFRPNDNWYLAACP
jgi:hypothetical protein